MSLVLVLVVLFLVVLLISAPLRRARSADGAASIELADLEAAREAKYREIRDAELDRSTGKLSDQDYDAVEQGLRAEAIEILRAIDRAQAGAAASNGHAAQALPE